MCTKRKLRSGPGREQYATGRPAQSREKAHFIAARTDNPDRARNDQEEQISCGRKGQTRGRHENGTDDQNPPPANPVRPGCQHEGNHHVARKRQRENQTALRFREPESNQVEHQNDRERPVRKQTRKARDKQKPPITSQALEGHRNQIGRCH
jgi:hypothetical protein